MRKALLLLLLSTALCMGRAWAQGEDRGQAAEIVAAGKRASARRLDPALPRVEFARWLARVLPRGTEIVWDANDCGEACGCPADSARDLPLCAEASAALEGGRTLVAWLQVGTISGGVAGEPAFRWAAVSRGDSLLATYSRLSLLESALGRAKPAPKR